MPTQAEYNAAMAQINSMNLPGDLAEQMRKKITDQYMATAVADSDGEFRYPDQPTRPKYTPAYDPLNMSLYQKTKGDLDAIKPDMSGYDAFKAQAMRSGPSAWAGLQKGRIGLEAAGAKDRGLRESGARAADASSRLAMRGGVTSGARERIAKQGLRDALDMNRSIEHDKGVNLLQTDINDEQNRIQQLGMLGSVQNQYLQPQFEKTKLTGQAHQFDIGQAVGEGQRANDFAMDKYKTSMGAWAANKQAKATEESGK